jgi:hypothetical protein
VVRYIVIGQFGELANSVLQLYFPVERERGENSHQPKTPATEFDAYDTRDHESPRNDSEGSPDTSSGGGSDSMLQDTDDSDSEDSTPEDTGGTPGEGSSESTADENAKQRFRRNQSLRRRSVELRRVV